MRYTDYIEQKRHGSHDFPIAYYYLDSSNPQYIMQTHWHKEFEILRVLKGCITVHLNNTEYTLNSGDILLIEGGCLHTGEPKQCVYECVVFDPSMLKRQQNDTLEKYISPIIYSKMYVRNAIDPCDQEITDSVSDLFEAIRTMGSYFELKIYGLLFSLLAQLYGKKYLIPSDKSVHSRQSQTVITLISWIEKNLSEPIDLNKLSSISGLSPKYLCRVFREYTSKTLVQYINELRIENACHEMSVNNKNITEASYASGFNDLSYFCKIFKQHKGITPKEFKKKYYSSDT